MFDFWATWCGPCKVISPIFERLAEQFPSVEFYKVDVDAAEQISQEVGIRAVRADVYSLKVGLLTRWGSQMPTFVLFKNGQKVKELVGANPAGLQVSLLTITASFFLSLATP